MNEIFLEPPLYFAQDHIFDIDFHPSDSLLACSLITGQINLLRYSQDEVIQLACFNHHKQSARISQFSPNGSTLLTASKDGSYAIIDSNGKLVSHVLNAHSQGINASKYLNENLISLGDDQGKIKIWDIRSNQCVYQVHEQKESISSFDIDGGMQYLVATSLDGFLGVFDLRVNSNSKNALFALSDCMEEDLTSVCIIKDGKFICVSTSEGNILIFKWDHFGDFRDRIIGHPNSIDTMIKVDEHTLLTGCEDGILRGVGVFPNQILGILGQHEEDQQFPISKIDIDHTRHIAASISHDNSIKFYDIIEFMGSRGSIQNFDPSEEYLSSQKQNMHQQKTQNDSEFEDDDEDSEDDEDEIQQKKKKVGKKNRIKNIQQSMQSQKKQNLKQFYKDL